MGREGLNEIPGIMNQDEVRLTPAPRFAFAR